jgi:AraC-like DNA-binding protein
MLYLDGNGYLRTTKYNYPFAPGTIIVVPPETAHGSVSEGGFCNISVGGAFGNLFHFRNTVVLSDNVQCEGKKLAEMLYNNRHKNNDYVSKLCSAYLSFILHNISVEDNISASVNRIINEITNRFYDCRINLQQLLRESGYAEDYIRSQFRKITGKTPNAFLTDIRIKNAVFLIDVYANTLTLQEISQRCGYTDYVYFSKKFKSSMGMSPAKYKNTVLN